MRKAFQSAAQNAAFVFGCAFSVVAIPTAAIIVGVQAGNAAYAVTNWIDSKLAP